MNKLYKLAVVTFLALNCLTFFGAAQADDVDCLNCETEISTGKVIRRPIFF